jgi:hypothetical protein
VDQRWSNVDRFPEFYFSIRLDLDLVLYLCVRSVIRHKANFSLKSLELRVSAGDQRIVFQCSSQCFVARLTQQSDEIKVL